MKNLMNWWQALEWNPTLELILLIIALLAAGTILLLMIVSFVMSTFPSSDYEKKELKRLYIKPDAARKRKIFRKQ